MIVESPAKAKKIAGYLGAGWRIEACRGHMCDLPEAELGVDIAKNFQPTYEILSDKRNLVKKLAKAIQNAEAVYIATDPDREGEAIAWHILKLADISRDKPLYRVVFHAITEEAVLDAVLHPRTLAMNLVEAQQTRRIVDRLVGYMASPLATKTLGGKFSAGRVQSVCLRLVVEREREIESFVPEQYFTLELKLKKDENTFTAKLHQIKGAATTFKIREPLDKLTSFLNNASFWVGNTARTIKARHPYPPFTTASLQQSASEALGLSPEKTMSLAQMLYEQGWITYMRTDGVAVATEAQAAARDYITREFGEDYLPTVPPAYTVKTVNSQEAHEAIRPTAIQRTPADDTGEGAALYALIWRRFIASQMSPALYTVSGAAIYAGKIVGQPFPIEFRAQGRSLLFDGFLKIFQELEDENQETKQVLPSLVEKQPLQLVAPRVEEHQTKSPTRYTEAGLILALEQRGIGRPSTYANMVKTVKEKNYVKLSQRQLIPTENGIRLCDFLTTSFGDVLALDYTSQLEQELDEIAAGKNTRLTVLNKFWDVFHPQIVKATESAFAQIKEHIAPKPLMLHTSSHAVQE
ncbi:MAG: type I DNA topoisomerase [Chloroflexi bacterium]|nr:type I DNA topoisomerase [Chloroflexota bacterium]